VRTDGIDFPYPGYLNNIVRQIALNFNAPQASSLRAEVAFTIRRDGSVADVRMVRGSGDYEFDLEARGAVEAAAARFGALPDGFSDDALPVVFSFDPQFIR
jgi:protein TonB